MSFEHKCFFGKNVFLKACFCSAARLFLHEMDQKTKTGGTISYGYSYLKIFFRQFKVIRIYALLHVAARAVRSHSDKCLGYCYMFGREPTSCLLGHVTGLLICLYVNLFLPSTFNIVDF